MRVPAGDRIARGVFADDAENRALRRRKRVLVNRLLGIVAISPFLAAGFVGDKFSQRDPQRWIPILPDERFFRVAIVL
jgi:hypothetical protein